MRNFLLRGPAGTGKTQGARAIAAGLHLPYMKYTSPELIQGGVSIISSYIPSAGTTEQ